ncbi:uncharacterized protein LOC122818665 isoform X2 [Drosophila biarmipes]|uniref:uncharacterized protein LOC122818665 isoform X2 n=1 Tax=Drosophila biarmipes TaxID=125945 RepID=UPI0021CC9EDB|nr:uncharacterized protein LOC122818665 isoform X2 [Drosophila biarmipes]
MIRKFVAQLLYGTALLTPMLVTPTVTLQLHLGSQESATATFHYAGFLCPAAVCLVLTAMAMSPYLVILKRWQPKHPRIFFLAMLLPYILVCCTRFVLNVRLELHAIFHVSDESRQNHLMFSLAMYCGMFGLAVELMLHWIVVYYLMVEDMALSGQLRNYRPCQDHTYRTGAVLLTLLKLCNGRLEQEVKCNWWWPDLLTRQLLNSPWLLPPLPPWTSNKHMRVPTSLQFRLQSSRLWANSLGDTSPPLKSTRVAIGEWEEFETLFGGVITVET